MNSKSDFIIVGNGLAAYVIAHTFHQNNISFKIIGNPSLSKCSQVAAGIWNPIVFKRLTKSWLANETVPFLNEFYSTCEKKLGVKLITQRELVKPFTEEQEKTLWQKKAKNELEEFLSDKLYSEKEPGFDNCIIPNDYGKVLQAGSLNVALFLEKSHDYFAANSVTETFDHACLKIEKEKISYKNIEAANIIFCEGYLVKNNPYFFPIPLRPVKGEIFTISSDKLKLKDSVFNKNGFLMDIDQQTYKVGATYDWNDLSEDSTEKGSEELKQKLKELISCDYQVTKHEAGIRPSSFDRRPIIGSHPEYKNLFVFNGLGTKGVMLAPYFANNFVFFYQQKQGLDPLVDVKRFYHLFPNDKQ